MNISSLSGTLPASVTTPAANVRQNVRESASPPPEAPLTKASIALSDAPEPVKEVEPSRKALDSATKAVNDFVGTVNNSLNFSIDDSTGKTVVKVIDVATKEVIKQFPSEEMLAIAKALDGIKGLLVQQKA